MKLEEGRKLMFEEYPDIVSAPQCAKMLHVTRQTVYAAIADGTLPSVRMGNGYKIPKVCIIQYLLAGNESK